MSYNMFAKVDIIDVENNNCTDHEVEQMLDLFQGMAKRAASLPTTKNRYSLEPLLQLDISKFVVTIEREATNETNRIFDDTEENFDCYIGTFTNKDGDKTLRVMAILLDNITGQVMYYDED